MNNSACDAPTLAPLAVRGHPALPHQAQPTLNGTTVSPQTSLTSGSFSTNPLHPRPSTTPVLFTPEQHGQPVPVTLPPSNNSVLLSVCHTSAAQEVYNSTCDTWSLSLLGLCFTSSHLTQPGPGEAVPAVGKSLDLSSASSDVRSSGSGVGTPQEAANTQAADAGPVQLAVAADARSPDCGHHGQYWTTIAPCHTVIASVEPRTDTWYYVIYIVKTVLWLRCGHHVTYVSYGYGYR
ncbi:hypothetical protein BC826DRAFT_973228 [Russula brevipes]|nr:hypothetical protein BC826DRAFT_973228 [Russula brevipes]